MFDIDVDLMTIVELYKKYHQKLNKVISKYSKCSRSVAEIEDYNEMI